MILGILAILGILGAYSMGHSSVEPSNIEIFNTYKESVYKVNILDPDTKKVRGSATSFAIEFRNHVVLVTNYHVCISLNAVPSKRAIIPVVINHNNIHYKSKVVYLSDNSDLCFIAAPPDATPLYLSDEPPIKKRRVYAIGAPMGIMSVSSGYIWQFQMKEYSDRNDMICDGHPMMHIEIRNGYATCIWVLPLYIGTISAVKGASGSPVITEDGDVVGVISLQLRATWSGIIPFDYLKINLIRYLMRLKHLKKSH